MLADHRAAVAAVSSGVVLGVVDFVWIKFLPSPIGSLGNSPAVWAVAAFWLGFWLRTTWARAAIAGAAMLVVAVPSYYLAATAIQGDALRSIAAPTSLLWMFFGVLAGALFGAAGAWARLPAWRAVIGAALPGAVSWGEAAMLLRRGRGDDAGTASLLAVLGVLAIVLSTRTLRQRLTALAVAVPLALLGFLAYRSVGMGGPL